MTQRPKIKTKFLQRLSQFESVWVQKTQFRVSDLLICLWGIDIFLIVIYTPFNIRIISSIKISDLNMKIVASNWRTTNCAHKRFSLVIRWCTQTLERKHRHWQTIKNLIHPIISLWVSGHAIIAQSNTKLIAASADRHLFSFFHTADMPIISPKTQCTLLLCG